MTNVRIGYFEEFKSSNTLFMEADAEGFRALAGMFRSLAVETLNALALHDLPFVEAHHGVPMTAVYDVLVATTLFCGSAAGSAGGMRLRSSTC